MRAVVGLALLAVMFGVPATPAPAKGSVDSIAITSPEGRRFEVREGDALVTFTPWSIAYIEGPAEPPASSASPFDVSFYLATDGAEAALIYSFKYLPGDDGSSGYIYLPGPGESQYRTNITTILASSPPPVWRNGAWHRATGAWVAFVHGLTAITPPRTGDGGVR